jgi:hypothetical protein
MEAVPAGQLQHLTPSYKLIVTHRTRITSDTKYTAGRLLVLLLLLVWPHLWRQQQQGMLHPIHVFLLLLVLLS